MSETCDMCCTDDDIEVGRRVRMAAGIVRSGCVRVLKLQYHIVTILMLRVLIRMFPLKRVRKNKTFHSVVFSC